MKNQFDKLAGNWDANQMHLMRTKAIAQNIIQTFALQHASGKAMEFGSGTGLLSFELYPYFNSILLLDGSLEMVKVANQKIDESGLRNLRSQHFDLDNENYQSKTFDFIFTQMAMHHVKDIEAAVIKFYHLLNDGGKIAIADLYTEDGSFHDWDFGGHLGFDPDKMAKCLERWGFKNVQYQQCYVIRKPQADNNTKEYPIFVLTAEK